MPRHVTVSAGTGRGRPEDEFHLAAVLTLLRRRSRLPIVVLSENPAATAAAHPDAQAAGADDLGVWADCEFLCITGALHETGDVERAARHAALARLSRVPVALLAVEVPEPENKATRAWLEEILAQSESVSASDVDSARRLAAWRGRRVDTTAPIELVLEPVAASRTGLGIDAR